LLISHVRERCKREFPNRFSIGDGVSRALNTLGASALVTGGSLAGLAAGLELRAAGLQVSIHERSERVLDDRGAGIVMQADTQQLLSERCGFRQEQTGVWLRYRQYLGKDGTPEFHQPMPQQMTSWGLLYRAMRTAFPKEAYFESDALVDFQSAPAKIYARLAKTGSMEADLLVAADGSRSLVRSVLFPDIKPRYAGYVAWRGVVAESDAGPELLKTFIDHFTFQHLPCSHIFVLPDPGRRGTNRAGGTAAQLGVVLERPRTHSQRSDDRTRRYRARLFGAAGPSAAGAHRTAKRHRRSPVLSAVFGLVARHPGAIRATNPGFGGAAHAPSPGRDGRRRGLHSAAAYGGEHVESGRQRPRARHSIRTSPAGH
jgi:2-polyprenyl-6-methoxyphenol hydroxylase-like FAD-dependent oxidoreductase